MFTRAPLKPDSPPDFTAADGTEWFLDDRLDFACPRTDYDHLCANILQAGTQVVSVGGSSALALDNDDTAAWWPEQAAILSGAEREPSAAALESAGWEPGEELLLEGPHCVLMNSTLHGQQVLQGDSPDEWCEVALDSGRYRFEVAYLDGTHVYRLIRC
jgi:hypothetical protein